MSGIEHEDLLWLTESAGIPPVGRVARLSGGWDNPNYRLFLEDGSSVVLKIWEGQEDEEGVLQVIERQKLVQRNGIRTVVPLDFADGSPYLEREGVCWTLMPYIEGGHLGSDPDSLNSLGKEMARMHQIPHSECFPSEYRMGGSLFDRIFDAEHDSEDGLRFISLLRGQSEGLLSEAPDDLPSGTLHGDLFPDNVLGDGRVAAILDFEEGFYGPCAFDLVMAFVGFGWEDGSPQMGRWESLRSGYESERKLTASEKSSLDWLHRYATLCIAAWRFWKHVISEFDESLSNRYMEMVDRLEVEVRLDC